MTYPIAVSIINNGTPNIVTESKYGTKKAPPPHVNTRYGNRQTLPNPTAYPIQDNQYSTALEN